MTELDTRKEKIALWKQAFADETTGIRATVSNLLWNYAAFRTSVSIVQIAGERNNEVSGVNRLLFDLIREGYWSSFLLGIRRLVDTDKASLKGRYGVYSIRSVLKDIKNSSDWLDRKKYVEYVRDAEYDLASMERELDSRIRTEVGPVWAPLSKIRSGAAHRSFDGLSRVKPHSRSETDRISPVFFEGIESRLERLKEIADHVDTHLAHSGNLESRRRKVHLTGFDLDQARDALRNVKEISDLLGSLFADEHSGGLAIPQYDQFEGLDKALVAPEDMVRLEERWRNLHEEISGWNIRISDW